MIAQKFKFFNTWFIIVLGASVQLNMMKNYIFYHWSIHMPFEFLKNNTNKLSDEKTIGPNLFETLKYIFCLNTIHML